MTGLKPVTITRNNAEAWRKFQQNYGSDM